MGPSLQRGHVAGADLTDVWLLPPARRGDVDCLVATECPADLLIADGVFHQTPAVGHREIKSAIDSGWRVWGVSSMGAIRAFELRAFGMIGYGKVYQWMLAHPEFTDDEVALLHSPEPPYTGISEPMIHLRFALAELAATGFIETAVAVTIQCELQRLFFGYRTLSHLRTLLQDAQCSIAGVPWEGWIRGFDRFRIKQQDVRDFFGDAPWRRVPCS